MQNIPLTQLMSSPMNVRKTGGASIDALAASIKAHGLLQNLTVVAHPNGYQVTSGGRRLRALQKLAKDGAIPGEYPVPCSVVGEVGASEKSIAENVIREAMHPADEFDAFAGMVKAGSSIEEVATRFGCTELHVRQRMQLASVAPEILAEYRENKISLRQVQALATTDDHEAQCKVWRAAGNNDWKRKPAALKAALTSKEVEIANDDRAKYVGVDAYIKAGGQVRKDLFAGETPTHMMDPQLLDQLVQDKLQKKADKLAKEGWKWVEVIPGFGHQEERKFSREPGNWVGGKKQYSDTVKAFAGCVVSLGYNGKAEVTEGLVRAGDKQAAPATSATGKKAKDKAKAKEAAGGLPFSEVQRLQGYRTTILQAEVASNQRFALAALAASLLEGMRGDGLDGVVKIGERNENTHANFRDGMRATPQDGTVDVLLEEFSMQYIDFQGSTLEWLLSQPDEVTLRALTLCTANAIQIADYQAPNPDDVGPRFAELAGVSFAGRWKPTMEWMQTLRKGVLVEILAEAAGKLPAAAAAKLSGAALHNFAWDHLRESGWLPKPLRAPEPVKPAKAKKARAPKKAAPATE